MGMDKELGMTSTGLWYRSDTKKNRIVTGYSENMGDYKKGPKISSTALYAPGGIVSTVDDLYKWNEALKEKTAISDFVVEQLTTEKRTATGAGTNYGYGLAVKNIQGSPTIQHSGILFGFTSTGLFLPKEDIYVCILSNSKFDRTEELANYCASVIMEKPMEIYSKSEISRELLKDYTGVYNLQSQKLSRTFELIIYNNQLILHDPKAPQNDAILTPSGKDRFLLKTAGAYFEFRRNTEDLVIELEINQKKDVFLFKKE